MWRWKSDDGAVVVVELWSSTGGGGGGRGVSMEVTRRKVEAMSEPPCPRAQGGGKELLRSADYDGRQMLHKTAAVLLASLGVS